MNCQNCGKVVSGSVSHKLGLGLNEDGDLDALHLASVSGKCDSCGTVTVVEREQVADEFINLISLDEIREYEQIRYNRGDYFL